MNDKSSGFICEHNECVGCHACISVCPKHCISMKPDPEGFLHPEIDSDRCVGCGKCRAVCPVLYQHDGNKTITAFAALNRDEKIRSNSSSGGIFTLLAENIIGRGGVVFGAAFDDDLTVKHIVIDSVKDIYKLRGSKYVQSRIGDAYLKAKAMIAEGRPVLFSGTPCQISGLKSFLGEDHENLITQDIICHGVSSPMVWRDYIGYMEQTYRSGVTNEHSPQFRNKTYGWHKFAVKLWFDNGYEYVKPKDKDLFMRSYLNNLCLRNSCYQCHFKSLKRAGDLTLADFWGGEQQVPELCDNKGTSLVLINSEKGRRLFDEINAVKIEVDPLAAVRPNVSAYRSVSRPKNRERFFADLQNKNFKKSVNKYAKQGTIKLAKKNIRRIVGKVSRIVRSR